ncbi:MAG: TetR/AcrR family transcriptional regulator [Pseudomonadota bacterium]
MAQRQVNDVQEPPPLKPVRRSQKERIEQSDKLMLDAAETLVLELGTHATTLREVGERAGYSRGLAHARFGSKEQLFMRLVERCLDNWFTELRRASKGKRGLAALMSRLDAVIEYAVSYPDDARVLYILWFESVGVSSPMKQRLGSFHRAARSDISELLQEAVQLGELPPGTDLAAITLLITSTAFGVAYQWLVDPDFVDVASAVGSVQAQILALLKTS